tara:strand:- start:25 stop:441 length:417 start_codon:yes stop_codon:yes gene_type:complete
MTDLDTIKAKKKRVRKAASTKKEGKEKPSLPFKIPPRISEVAGLKYRERNTEGPDLSGFKKLFKKTKAQKLYDDKMVDSVTGSKVGTAKAFKDAGLEVPKYSSIYDSKSGGNIKKKMKKTKVKKRAAIRGQRKELRGS